MKAMKLLRFCSMIVAVLASPVSSSLCSVSLPPHLRKDCHPDPGASEVSCLARNCCWSPFKTPGIPWCFEGVDACSAVPVSERVDCYLEPEANEASCENRGCHWCPTDNATVPFCFYNSKEEAECITRFPLHKRVDCHPQPGATREACEAKGCFWCSTNLANVPWCFYPADGPYGYTLSDQPQKTAKGWRMILNKRDTISLFGDDISPIAMDIEYHTKDRLRFKIYDPNNERFEVPLNIDSPPNTADDRNYEVEFRNDSSFQFRIIRKITGTVLWETSFGGLIFSNQFIHIKTTFSSSSVYGFGEHEHPSFKHTMNYVKYGMFSRDQAPVAFGNLYGVHPFYMCIENDFNAHGVLLLNSNAQDVTLSPHPSITFQTIGGVLDFYMFLGPTPENVVQQYTEAIGRPFMPPYWSLGFQLSRWGYNNIKVLQKTVERLKQYNIPHDVQYGDIDYMDCQLDFTYDKTNFAGLPEYVKALKKDGMHYVIILDPFLTKDEPEGTYKPYDLGQEMGIWINNSDGATPAIGRAWPPGDSVFPDYTNPLTTKWWIQMCMEFKNIIDYDGIWINTGEATVGEGGGQKELLYDHNRASIASIENTNQERNSGQFYTSAGDSSGSTISQHENEIYFGNTSRKNIFPQVGADICGFNEDTNYELCLRWMQLGAFYPFSRNHNSIGSKEQDPGVFGEEFATISRSVLLIRYTLLPYLYTLFYHSHISGIFYPKKPRFTSDPQTHGIDKAFLWGSSLMITPVLEKGAKSVTVYFPEAFWYNFYTGEQVPPSWQKMFVEIPAPLDIIPLFIRGGNILPIQAPARTTEQSRLNPFGLIISLDEQEEACGSLFWDDGDSIDSIEKENYFYAEYKFSNVS
ncbi:sucrase-isomaltase, intestinal-like [Orycteropus afer afer]|uniref:Sucrase-isomaltase, intestinal-like n=1 Tax=Orycteropus afer afer TaxID=1230840 RepID=A0AC54Z8H8_ORYAF|nr:sucrase-isomaltase, intestinal-like [Orycteropus afer afer]